MPAQQSKKSFVILVIKRTRAEKYYFMNLYSLSPIKLNPSFSFEFLCFQTVEMFHKFDMFQTLGNQ